MKFKYLKNKFTNLKIKIIKINLWFKNINYIKVKIYMIFNLIILIFIKHE